MIDVILVAKSSTVELQAMTEACLASLYRSEPQLELHPIVAETSGQQLAYAGAEMVYPDPQPLNYNRYLNAARPSCRGEFVACCNNDLVFHPGWLTSHLQVFSQHPTIGCLSSRDPADTELARVLTGLCDGYQVNREVFQWCMLFRRQVLERLGPFDEQFAFWGADDAICWQLQRHGVRHCLNADSHVTHLGSRSHQLLSPVEHAALTYQQGQAIASQARLEQARLLQVGRMLPGSFVGAAGVP